MARYTKRIVERICQLHAEDSFTVEEICKDVGIAQSTYFDWKAKKPEFLEAIEKAQQKFKDELLPLARRSLKKLVKGYTVTETKIVKTDSGKKDDENKPIMRIKENAKTKKHIQPNLGAVIFTLTNTDPENWKNRQDTSVQGDFTLRSKLETLTDRQLERIIKGDGFVTSDNA